MWQEPSSFLHSFVHSFIQTISIAPLQVHFCSEALPTQHGYCTGVSRQSATVVMTITFRKGYAGAAADDIGCCDCDDYDAA